MGSKRRCFVHLPNEKKLELTLQPKSTGRELVEHITNHFQLKEREYFGVYFKSNSGHYAWLQDDKKILDHDVKKTKLDFYFAFKYFVESVVYLKHCLTIELLYLHINSLIYKSSLETDADTAFKLAAYVLQICYGDYSDDQSALENLRDLAVLSDQVLQQHPISHCEKSVLKLYKELNGWSKGKSILRYITLVEAVPAYGVHYYRIKEKGGKFLWIGLSFRGIFLFELDNKRIPFKSYLWCQIENLYYRDKKFSIEVGDRVQRRLSADAKTLFAVEPRSKSKGQIKVYSWYGNPALIKSIWQMSTSQHKFFLENQKKTKFKDFSSFSNLANDLTNNNNTLIKKKKTEKMKLIKSVDDKANGEKEIESLEVQIAKKEMHEGLKTRRTELEDKLFDKVNELKQLCLQEADIIGKYPPEYIRYMDYNEKLPKIKKRIGAEFKLKLRKSEGPQLDRDLPNTVTASSSTSSGISSSGLDPADELAQLEQEFDILTQIANAAKKLATDPSAKRRTKKKRIKSFKKAADKLQAVEVRLNAVRKKVGQQPSIRASMLITEEDELMFEQGKINYSAGTESERSSISEGALLGDESSLSSADMLSIPNLPLDSISEEISRKRISSSDVDISKTRESRSFTPPPSFERPDFESKTSIKTLDENSLVPSPRSSSGVSMDSSTSSINKKTSPRNWFRPKWSTPRAKQNEVWKESSLDSIDAASTPSRKSQDSLNSSEIDMRTCNEVNSRFIIPFGGPAVTENVAEKNVHPKDTEKSLINELIANSNQSNRHKSTLNDTKLNSDENKVVVDGLPQNFTNIQITVSADDMSSTDQKSESNPNLNTPDPTDYLGPVRLRKRSSSFTDTSSSHISQNEVQPTKDGTLKSSRQPQYLTSDVYHVQEAFLTSSSHPDVTGHPGLISKSRSSQDLNSTASNNGTIRTYGGGNVKQGAKTLNSWKPLVPNPPVQSSTETDHGQLGFRQDQPPPAYNDTLKTTLRKKQGLQYVSDVSTQPSSIVSTNSKSAQSHHLVTSQTMTSAQRDMLNNEVYQDIGMGWVPSINEYSSRASVCESTSVLSRKEDILSLLKDHLASKPRVSPERGHHNRVRKMREQYRALQEQNTYANKGASSGDKTWANYQKQPVYSGLSDQRNKLANMAPGHLPSNELRRSPAPTQPNVNPEIKPKPRLKTHQQAPASMQDPFASNTVQYVGHLNSTVLHPGHHTDLTNVRGWHGNHELDVKQQILLRHYMHHARSAEPLDHVRTNHVHGTNNQKHELKRQHNFENGDPGVFPTCAASSNGQQRLQTQRWMSQPTDTRQYEVVLSPRGYQDMSSTPFNDPGSADIIRSRTLSNRPFFRDSDKNIPPSVAKHLFLQNPYNLGFSAPRSAPNTPLLEHEAPSFDDGSLVSKDTLKRNLSRGKDNAQSSLSSEGKPTLSGSPQLPSNLLRAPSSDSFAQHFSEDGKVLLEPHLIHRGSPSFHHTQSSPLLSSFRDSSLRSQSLQFLHGSHIDLVDQSFHHATLPAFIDSIPFHNSEKHLLSFPSSRGSFETASSGGTLPRAMKSERSDPSKSLVSGNDSIPFGNSQMNWNTADTYSEKRSSLSSQRLHVKRRLYSTSCIPYSPSPTQEVAPIRTQKQIGHSRSRSEVSKVPIHPVSVPHDPSRYARTSSQGSKYGGISHRPIEEASYNYYSNSLRRIKKQSNSADDLLLSGSTNNQPGTLV